MVMLEAFALGCPVVAPTVGGIPDLLGHGEEGLWVPPGDAQALAAALDRLAAEPGLRQRLAAGAARAGPRHDSARQAEELAALYAQLIPGARAGRGARAAPGETGATGTTGRAAPAPVASAP